MMQIKDYLNSIKFCEDEIQSFVQQKEQLRCSIELKTTNFNENKVQESSKIYDDKYIKYIEVCEILNKKIDDLIALKLKISNEIDLLDKGDERIVLRKKYINLMTFEQIAVDIDYDIRSVHRIHGNALQSLDKVVTKCHSLSS